MNEVQSVHNFMGFAFIDDHMMTTLLIAYLGNKLA